MSNPAETVANLLQTLGVKAGGEGWAGVDPTNPASDENKKRNALERYNRARVISDGISDEALEVMREFTIEAQTFNVPDLGLVNAIGFGIWREGQNALVRWIEQQKKIAAQGPSGEGSVPGRKKARKRS